MVCVGLLIEFARQRSVCVPRVIMICQSQSRYNWGDLFVQTRQFEQINHANYIDYDAQLCAVVIFF